MAQTPNYMGTPQWYSHALAVTAETDFLIPAHSVPLCTGGTLGSKILRLGVQILSTTAVPPSSTEQIAYFFKGNGGFLIPPVPFGGMFGNYVEIHFDDDPPRSRPLFIPNGLGINVSQNGTAANVIAFADVVDG